MGIEYAMPIINSIFQGFFMLSFRKKESINPSRLIGKIPEKQEA
jgi:hypothetical protein